MKKLAVFSVAALAMFAACSDNPTGILLSPADKPLKDNVQSEIDEVVAVSGDMSLSAGGAEGIAKFTVQANNAGGLGGCDIGGDETLVLSVSSSNGNVATVSPSLIAFTNCTDQKTVTVTSGDVGSAEITVSPHSSNTAVGHFNYNSAKFTVIVTAASSPNDITPPSISYTLNPVSPDGSNGWYNSDVTLTWTVTEDESAGTLVKTGCVDQNIVSDQAETTYSCSASSAGGSAGPVEVKIKRDATAPSVSLVGGPIDGGTYYFGSVPAAPTCSATDALSDLADACSVSGYGTSVGTHTVTASAIDNAGNNGSASVTYEVLAWTATGYYQPVNTAPGFVNTVKGGSTVPLKFEVFAGSTELTTTNVIVSFQQERYTCESAGSEEPVEITTTGGTSLRYDSTAGQFVQNWQTPKQAGSCYRAIVKMQDGSSISANFKLK
jgi:hypothetical protein